MITYGNKDFMLLFLGKMRLTSRLFCNVNGLAVRYSHACKNMTPTNPIIPSIQKSQLSWDHLDHDGYKHCPIFRLSKIVIIVAMID